MISKQKIRLFTACFFQLLCYQLAAQEKPNIILILTDDMGFSDISCYGGKFVETPNIDQLAAEGSRYTQYYSASPICSPSRVSLLTGMFPAKWNFTNFLNTTKANKNAQQADFLDPNAPSIARVFQNAGYATGHFGKWHMGGGRDVTNAPSIKKYGFDAYNSTWESPDPDPLLTSSNWIWAKTDSVKRWERTKYFVDKTLDFLKANKNKPCFINLWPDDVHTPWVPKTEGEYNGKFPLNPKEEATFKLVLKEYDKQIGRLLSGIKSLGIENNTIIIFTSDNGPLPSFNGTRANGLRGSKLSLYEGGTRMPFIIKWPRHIPAKKLDTLSVINSTDLFPSLAEMAGLKLSKNYKSDGENRSAIFFGKTAKRKKDMYWEYGRDVKNFNYPDGKDKSPNLAIRSGDWKLLLNHDGSEPELYNILNDKNETLNLTVQKPKLTKKLSSNLLKWWNNLPKLENN
ncbi:sulfatase-like hydrolase/transferase [Flavobacterium flevense]|nr:sulfatase-like hydrolase/transferase [Flavobacterium flevense]